MSQAAIIPQDPIYLGDTWPGFPAILIRINEEIPAATLVSARLIFFQAERGAAPPALELTSAEGITITDAGNWELEIPPQDLDALGKGEWTFRLSCTDSDGLTRTHATGTLTIL